MTDQDPPAASAAGSKIRAGFLTITGLATIVGILAMPVLAGPPAEGAISQWGRFIGRFHPVLLHLPIGMLALVLLLEFGKLFKKDKGSSTLVPAFLTAMFSVLAVIAGFLLYMSKPDEYNAKLIDHHLWWGIGFACSTVAAFVVKSWVDLAEGKGNFFYLLTLLASGGVMAVSSHDGGSLTHGKTFLTEEMPEEIRPLYNKLPGVEKLKVEEEGGSGGVGGGEGSSVPLVPLEEQVVYTDIVQPIFDQKCVSCHGEEKQKGKLRMDNYEVLLAGGKEGEGFEPGDAEDSNILFRIYLEEDDDEHMPPEGKKQIDEHELVILEWWINSGASPEARVGELEMPEEVKSALANRVPPEVLEQQETAKLEQAEKEKEARKALVETVGKLRSDFPSALDFESRDSSGLTFNTVSLRDKFTDAELAKLEPVMPALVTLDLSASKVTDEGIKAIADARKLRQLRLSETEITDAALETIAGLAELESLNLYGTAVTASGVAELAGLPNLKRLYLWQTDVDEKSAEDLRKKMPHCEIVMGL